MWIFACYLMNRHTRTKNWAGSKRAKEKITQTQNVYRAKNSNYYITLMFHHNRLYNIRCLIVTSRHSEIMKYNIHNDTSLHNILRSLKEKLDKNRGYDPCKICYYKNWMLSSFTGLLKRLPVANLFELHTKFSSVNAFTFQ